MCVIMEISQKILTPRASPSKVTGTNTDRSDIYDFLLVIHSNHGSISSRIISEIKRYLQNSLGPVYLMTPMRGVPLVTALELKTRMMLFQTVKKCDNMSIHLDTSGQTDGIGSTISHSASIAC